MNNRALIGLSAAAMSALVATAVGCGEPAVNVYVPPVEEEVVEVAAPQTEDATEATAQTEPEAAQTEAEPEAAEPEASEPAEPQADEPQAEAGAYQDGTYEAAKNGIGGKVPVTVTIEGGKVASVEVGENSETQGIGTKAIEQLPALIVEANGTEGVDAVSGASVTSQAILKGVAECLEAAQA